MSVFGKVPVYKAVVPAITTLALAAGGQIWLTYDRVADNGYPYPTLFRHFLYPAVRDDLARFFLIGVPCVAILLAVLTIWNRKTRVGWFIAYPASLYFLVSVVQVFPAQPLLLVALHTLWTSMFILAARAISRVGTVSRIAVYLGTRGLRYYSALGIVAVIVVGSILGVMRVQWNPKHPYAAASTPPILYILVDAMRGDLLTAPENAEATGHMRALARDGVFFTEAASPSYWTGDSLTSMFTGLMPSAFQEREEVATWPHLRTFVQTAFEAGYETTAITGSAFVAAENLDRYFQRLVHKVNPVHSYLLEGDVLRYYRGPKPRPDLLYLHFIDAHEMYYPRDEYRPKDISRWAMWRNFLIKHSRQGGPESPEMVRAKRLYTAEVHHVDDQLGRIFDEMKKQGVYDKTLIILTADHGEAFKEHGIAVHLDAALYRELMHVPLIVKFPQNRLAGTVVDRTISNLKTIPIIADTVHGELPDDKLREYVTAKTSDEVFAEDGYDQYGLIQGRW
ncbi:sulfatase-like hydrolase/transferase, partial [bacterium]|nr:sulfatase-like hydrolase/transferase [bacterium]